MTALTASIGSSLLAQSSSSDSSSGTSVSMMEVEGRYFTQEELVKAYTVTKDALKELKRSSENLTVLLKGEKAMRQCKELEISRLNHEMGNLHGLLKANGGTLAASALSLYEASDEITKHQATIKHLRRELDDANKKWEEAQKIAKSKEDERLSLISEKDRLIESLREEVRKLRETCATESISRAKIAECQRSLVAKDKIISGLRKELATIKQERATLRAVVSPVEDRMGRQDAEIREQEERYLKLRDQLRQAEEESSRRISGLEKELTLARADLQKSLADKEELQRRVEAERALSAELEIEKCAVIRDITALQEKFSVAKVALINERDSFRKEVERYRKMLSIGPLSSATLAKP